MTPGESTFWRMEAERAGPGSSEEGKTMTERADTEVIARIMATGYNRHTQDHGPDGSHAGGVTESGDGHAVLVFRDRGEFSVRVERLPAKTAGAPLTPGQCWAALRDQITRDAATEQELGDDYSESSGDLSWDSANNHWGRAEALREVLATMDRMEAGR